MPKTNYPIFIIIFWLLLLMGKNVTAQYTFNLLGTDFNKYNESVVELHYTDYSLDSFERFVIQAKIKNGSFYLSGNIMNPAVDAYLYFPAFKRQYIFVLDSGKMEIKFKDVGIGKINIPENSETNKLNKEFAKLTNENIYYGKPTGNQTMIDIRKKELELVKRNLENFYSLIKLAQLSNSIFSLKPDEINEVFEHLDLGVKSSNLGNWMVNKMMSRNNAKMGSTLPSFTFFDESGKTFTNDDLLSKPYVLAFTAYWCGPCKKQIPALKEILQAYEPQQLEIIYINLDSNKEKWIKMMADYHLDAFRNVTDTLGGNKSIMAKKFFIHALPTNIVIDKNKMIQYNSAEIGDLDLKQIRSYIDKAILE